MEDSGPGIVLNFSSLDETQAFSLAVQSFTLLGMGTGSRSSGSWMNHLFGPLPVPTGQLINALIYPFLIIDQSSSDSRVRKAGRSCSLIILLRRSMQRYDEFRIFLENFLPKWLEAENFSEKNFKQLEYVLAQHPSLQSAKEDFVLSDKSEEELKNILREQQDKILLMQQFLWMESLTKSLINLYDTNPNTATIKQLARLSGTSKLMLNFHLRKFVKAGIISLDGQQIHFNTGKQILNRKIKEF